MNPVDQYIATFPLETQALLEQLRSTIKKTVPDAEEVISYKMPAYKLHGILVYFAGNKHHIGFYPTPSAIEKFKEELTAYKHSKGAIQFPINKPLPFDLIAKITAFRVQENVMKEALRR